MFQILTKDSVTVFVNAIMYYKVRWRLSYIELKYFCIITKILEKLNGFLLINYFKKYSNTSKKIFLQTSSKKYSPYQLMKLYR